MTGEQTASADSEAQALTQQLAESLQRLQLQARFDPFTNAYLQFARTLERRLASGALDLDDIGATVAQLVEEAFEARADRLSHYLGSCDSAELAGRLTTLFDDLASSRDFEAFADHVGGAPFGVVLTAHPTFALSMPLSRILVELASGRDAAGQSLGPEQRRAHLDEATRLPHGPQDDITLDLEHAWSLLALENAHTAMEVAYRCVLRVARARWPQRWTELTPRLLTLASWVGFDQDGRTDITWQVSMEKRLALKRAALARRLKTLEGLAPPPRGEAGPWARAVYGLTNLLRTALTTVDDQGGRLAAARADPSATPAFAHAMVDGRDRALVEHAPLLKRLEAALAAAPDDDARETLLILRAGLATEGVSLAGIHVRLNAGQLHNAIRRRIGLDTSPADPANRRTYFAAIDTLIAQARPVEINFGDLIAEPASAPRLMMTVAQMLKFVDASPVRFLIAETETGFTLLTALYFARLFGVEAQVEISPLFETEEALERGERVIEEALRSEHYRAHLQRQGRLAIEFGFSDSGRFIGQMAATFRIERLRLRLAQMLEAQGLTNLEVVFFNTHGESVGRGGHPVSLSDRFRYAAPPRSRAEFAARGIRIKEEDAFQGGEGYLPLLTPPAALATISAALQSVFADDPEAVGDPIYEDPDFAAEFFATVQQDFTSLAADPDYATLVGMFGTHLLPKTGSRPVQRQAGDAGVRKLRSVAELRAIPNNALLQQLGYFANTLFGVGHAAVKDLETFAAMRAASPRFRRAIAMVEHAARCSDVKVIGAYAATLDPGLWLDRAELDATFACDLNVGAVAERSGLGDGLIRLMRRLQGGERLLWQAMRPAGDGCVGEERERLLLMHAVRLALIQRICVLAVQFPAFSPRGDITQGSMQERLMRLDVPAALEALTAIFPPRTEGDQAAGDFGEASSYATEDAHAYRAEHEAVFEPLAQLYALLIRIGAGVTHEIGAFG